MLADLSGEDIEFLPFDRIKGRELFAVNVLRIENFIDENRTEFIPGMGIPARVAWKTNLPDELRPVFKVSRSPSTYVTRAFAETALQAGLTGVSLADPAKDRLKQIIQCEPVNEFPGLGLVR